MKKKGGTLALILILVVLIIGCSGVSEEEAFLEELEGEEAVAGQAIDYDLQHYCRERPVYSCTENSDKIEVQRRERMKPRTLSKESCRSRFRTGTAIQYSCLDSNTLQFCILRCSEGCNEEQISCAGECNPPTVEHGEISIYPECLVNCEMGYVLEGNACVIEPKCTDDSECESNEICVEGACVEEITGYCCLDNSLKIGSHSEESCEGDDLNVESVPIESIEDCRELTVSNGYRYSPLYSTTPEFALVCTEGTTREGILINCSMDDEDFFDASFQGHMLGIEALKEATNGILPKKKMEFHLAQDGDCFQEGYGVEAGYAWRMEGHAVLCNSGYKEYLKRTGWGESKEDLLEYYKTIGSQMLIIHEPIHTIFHDYYPGGLGVPKLLDKSPEYKIQESFCRSVSQRALWDYWHSPPGIKSYDDLGLIYNFSIDNPPSEESLNINSFFVYSLHKRFGFDEGDTKEFFRQYKDMENAVMSGNLRVKTILDETLGTDTTASFNDVGVSFE